MQEKYVSRGTVVVATAWAWALGLLMLVWAASISHLDRDLLIAMAVTTCVVSSGAVAATIHQHMVRLACLVRVSTGLDRPDGPVLRSLDKLER